MAWSVRFRGDAATLRRIRALVGVLAVTCAVAAPALGATRKSSVSVSGPATARANRAVKLLFRGYAARPANELVIYLDDRTCASTGRTEGKRSEVRAPTLVKGLSRWFSARLTVQRSATGTHIVCGYVESQSSGQTFARASARYVTR